MHFMRYNLMQRFCFVFVFLQLLLILLGHIWLEKLKTKVFLLNYRLTFTYRSPLMCQITKFNTDNRIISYLTDMIRTPVFNLIKDTETDIALTSHPQPDFLIN